MTAEELLTRVTQNVDTTVCDFCGHLVIPANRRAKRHVCGECLKDWQVAERCTVVEDGDAA